MTIDSFSGPHRFLSNFARGEREIVGYPTVEHFYQAMKTFRPDERRRIWGADTPGEAKRMGKNVSLRPDWEKVKFRVMRFAIMEKFSPGTEDARLLVATDGHLLVEGNHWHDNIWGDCHCSRCEEIPGQNHLGSILMKQRSMLIKARLA